MKCVIVLAILTLVMATNVENNSGSVVGSESVWEQQPETMDIRPNVEATAKVEPEHHNEPEEKPYLDCSCSVRGGSVSLNTTCSEYPEHPTTRWSEPLHYVDSNVYFFSEQKANWFSAAHQCRMMGLHIASITSKTENDRLGAYMVDNGFQGFYYLGASNHAYVTKYIWASSGHELEYQNWPKGRRHEMHQVNCATAYASKDRNVTRFIWNSNGCNEQTNFICELCAY